MRNRAAILAWVAVAASALCGAACGSREDVSVERSAGSQPPVSALAPVIAQPPASAPQIVVLGDSLTAGLGVAINESYPALLQQRLLARGLNYRIVNAGVSGDTSAGGLARLDDALQGDVRMLIVALGANDGLRGLPPEELERNLSEIIERAQRRYIAVILAGMEAPPNFGVEYTRAFHQVYPGLARKYHVALVPFLLLGVAGDSALNQQDGIHPNARGARMVADNVWTVVQPALDKLPRRD
jgi:acyl-CoA thioesterase-1